MTIDKEKLKDLAEQSALEPKWYKAGSHGLKNVSHLHDREFIAAASPATILALLAEIERLDGCDKAYAEAWEKARGLQAEMDDVVAERDQLKAENEALRKAVAGKVVCDVDLFEDLRDSAASEADEHRQHMAAYRPQRQEVLDWTVKRCDLLLAAAREASNG